jgi:hypothetical protein
MAREVRVVEDRWGAIRRVVETIAIVTGGLWAKTESVFGDGLMLSHRLRRR